MAQYQAITVEDRLAIATDALRAAETDQFRISLLDENSVNAGQLDLLAKRADKIRGVIADLEKEAAANAKQAAS